MELKAAERECLDARAAYMLRQSVVEDVLIADPILKAVHSGANASPTERFVTHASWFYSGANTFFQSFTSLN